MVSFGLISAKLFCRETSWHDIILNNFSAACNEPVAHSLFLVMEQKETLGLPQMSWFTLFT